MQLIIIWGIQQRPLQSPPVCIITYIPEVILGMKPLILAVLLALAAVPFSASAGQNREYWVAAEPVTWDYAPSGKNLIHPGADMGPWGKQLRYAKYRFVGYTDASYKTPVPQPEWQGILGPELVGEVGDTLKVHFLNRADRPFSMHPHGLRYDEDNDGADHRGAGASIAPGASFTYTWVVDEKAGPGPTDPSSIVWLYHSHVDHVDDIYRGLIGTIVVTRKGMAISRCACRRSAAIQAAAGR